MTERAFQSAFDGENPQSLEGSAENGEFLSEMKTKLARAVLARKEGLPQEVFCAYQAEATRYINDLWPGDKILQLDFTEAAMVFERYGLKALGESAGNEKTASSFQANRHAGFGARGALFVNDMSGESVYFSEPFSTNLDFVER